MNMLSKNIRSRLRDLGMTQKVLAEKAGISQVMVHKLLSGKTQKTSKVVALAKALECDPGWLQEGDSGANVLTNESNAYPSATISEWDETTPIDEEEVSIPFISSIELSAGNGCICDQSYGEADRTLRFRKSTLRKARVDWDNAVCVSVSGNSMEPVLLDGSTVGINCSETDLVNGTIYAINHAGELFIKRLYKLPNGGLRVYSFNEVEYPPREYTKEQVIEENIVILGKVFWYSVLF